jgi:hypothetical protein
VTSPDGARAARQGQRQLESDGLALARGDLDGRGESGGLTTTRNDAAHRARTPARPRRQHVCSDRRGAALGPSSIADSMRGAALRARAEGRTGPARGSWIAEVRATMKAMLPSLAAQARASRGTSRRPSRLDVNCVGPSRAFVETETLRSDRCRLPGRLEWSVAAPRGRRSAQRIDRPEAIVPLLQWPC